MIDSPDNTNSLTTVSDLFEIGKERSGHDDNTEQVDHILDLLVHELAQPYPPPSGTSTANVSSLSLSSTRSSKKRSNTLAEVLRSDGTSLVVLREIKQLSKSAVKRASNHAEQAVATAIYYTAVARARLRYQERIAARDDEQLIEAYRMLIGKSWLPGWISQELRRAGSLLSTHD